MNPYQSASRKTKAASVGSRAAGVGLDANRTKDNCIMMDTSKIVKQAHLRCACCLRWIDTGRESIHISIGGTLPQHNLCERCMNHASRGGREARRVYSRVESYVRGAA